jgi:hypothetical protein
MNTGLSQSTFDPDAYLASGGSASAFDPDAYLNGSRNNSTPPSTWDRLVGRGGLPQKSSAAFNHVSPSPFAPLSSVEAGIRGAANAATFNLMPMIAAAGDATIPLDGGSSNAKTWAQRYQENLTNQKAVDHEASSDHPTATIAGSIAGGVMNPVTRALPIAGTITKAIGQGAAVGAGYGAGAALSDQDDLPTAAKEIGEGAALGGAIPAAIPAVGAVARGAGRMVPAVLGNLTTGVGANAMRGAYDAGVQGGDQGAAFLANMRGDANWQDVVDQAKDALGRMRLAKNAAYRSGMQDISADKSVLDFDPIQKAFDDASNIQTFKGQKLGGAADDTQERLQGIIDNWKKLTPEDYHTPEGMDFLKQQVGEVLADTKPNTASSAMAGKVYSAVKSTIQGQAPTYAKVMSDYSDASDAVNDIQRELSLGAKGNPATALRKLQSVMRDNANTSWGQRADYADTLADNGADTLMPSLAGQALSPLMPRGLSKIGAGADLALAAMHNPAALAALPITSPRVVGEAAYGLGRGVGAIKSAVPKSALTANLSRMLSDPRTSALVPALLPRLPQQ